MIYLTNKMKDISRIAKKLGAICILSIFFMLLYSFHPNKGFDISVQGVIGTSNSFPENQINNTLQNIQNTIQQLRIRTEQSEKVLRCSRFFKLSQTNHKNTKQMDVSEEICESIEFSQVQIIYLTIILPKNYDKITSEDINYLQGKLQQTSHLEVRIEQQTIDYSKFPQHLWDKVNNQDYMESIAIEVREMGYIKHCRFTNKKCKNHILFLQNWKNLEDGFYKIGNVYFSKPQHYKQTILKLIFGELNSLSIWQRVNKIRNLQRFVKQIRYMEKLRENHMVKPNTIYLMEYLQQVEGYIKDVGPPPPKLIFDQAAVITDFFPSEYKIGVYLPLFLIFVVFPCANILKI